MNIEVRQLSENEFQAKDIATWPLLEKEVSKFSHFHAHTEACYVTKGRAYIISEECGNIEIKKGDYVVIPKGLECYWQIEEPIQWRSHADES